ARYITESCEWIREVAGEAALEAHRAVAGAGVHPVLLDEVVRAAERDVVERAVRRLRGGAEGPGALVGVLLAAAIVPGVQIGIADRLFALVRDDRRHPVGARVAVRARGLLRARRGTAIGVADERILDVGARDGAVVVPAAVLRAEAARRVDVGRGQDEVD